MQLTRIGSCQNCGDCCILWIKGQFRRCDYYRYDREHHCTVHDGLPPECKTFPRGPIDIQDKPNCGYQFLDQRGNVIDGFQDPNTRIILIPTK